MKLIALMLLVAVSASAKRVSRSGSGSSDCRAVRVLAIGGELQANTWGDCKKREGREVRKEHNDKVERERKEYKDKQDKEREKRKDEAKRHDCRGIGSGANCTEENPGRGNDKAKAKKAGAAESKKKH